MSLTGEGFAVRHRKCRGDKTDINSRVFSNPKGSMHHDHKDVQIVGPWRLRDSRIPENCRYSQEQTKKFSSERLLEGFHETNAKSMNEYLRQQRNKYCIA